MRFSEATHHAIQVHLAVDDDTFLLVNGKAFKFRVGREGWRS